jgi:hypothetical protein
MHEQPVRPTRDVIQAGVVNGVEEVNMWSDTAWTTNQILWRGEERIAVAYQKPKAFALVALAWWRPRFDNIIEGFPGAGS